MSEGDGHHTFGHGQFCYWCGIDGDTRAVDQPCDERERKKPSAEAMAAFDARYDLGERIGAIAADFGLGMIEWDEMVAKIVALKSAPKDGP